MAQQIPCDVCSAEQAVLLITNIANGQTYGLGPDCIRPGLLAMADSLDPEPAAPAETGVPETEQPAPAEDPHAPAETGPGTYSDAPDPAASPLPAEDPHAPAVNGPGTYEEEGGAAAPPAPADPTAPDQQQDPNAPPEAAPGPEAAPDPGTDGQDGQGGQDAPQAAPPVGAAAS